MNLVYVLHTFPSDTEHFILNEIIALRKRGLHITIFSLKNGMKKYCDYPKEVKELISSVIYFQPFSLTAFTAYLYCISSFFKTSLSECIKAFKLLFINPGYGLKRFRHLHTASFFIYQLRKHPQTHIHAHFASMPASVASIIAAIASLKYSITAHAHDIYTHDPFFNEKIENASFVITCSGMNKRFIQQKTGRENVFHVYHGINITNWPFFPRQYMPSTQGIKVLCVARLVEKKGIIYLLRAVKILASQKIHIQCSIVGDGPEYDRLAAFVKEADLEEQVEFLGYKPQKALPELYRNHDVFILPCIVAGNNDKDGLPNVLLEAMASGIPVISTNISAIPEILENKKNGLVIESKDEWAIASAIKLLMEDTHLFSRIIDEGRTSVTQNFNIENCTDQLYSIFQQEVYRESN